MTQFIFHVDTLLISESNVREHWGAKSRRKKEQRSAVRLAWVVAGRPVIAPPVSLRLTRIVPKKRFIRDYDNLVGCFKAVIDEVAAIIEVDDKDLIWSEGAFMQQKGKSPACRVEIESLAGLGSDLSEMGIQFFMVLISRWTTSGFPPTLAEMNKDPRSTWKNPQHHFITLEDKGYIERSPGLARGIKLTKRGRHLQLSLAGDIKQAK